MDKGEFNSLVKQLYHTVARLESMFPGRHFTLDGHLIGSLGECLVAEAYNLDLKAASNKGFDAVDARGRKVEIKATQGNRVAFRSSPDFAIVIKINKDGSFEEIYNGPGHTVWGHFQGRKRPDNGQYQITLGVLEKLNADVRSEDRIREA